MFISLRKLLLPLLLLTSGTAQSQNLDQLLQGVLQGSQQEQQQAQKIVSDFSDDLKTAQQQLKQSQLKLKQLHQSNGDLENRLLSLQQKLRQNQKNWNEEKQDLQGLLKTVSEQSQLLLDQVKPYGLLSEDSIGIQLLDSEKISLQQMQQLWQALVQQIVVSGKTRHSEQQILDGNGNPQTAQVTRHGPFTAFAQTADSSSPLWLAFLAEQQSWQALNPQPELTAPAQGMIIDPAFGDLLRQQAAKPDWFERLKPAGVVGILIGLTGLIGLLIAIIRISALSAEQKKVRQQQKQLAQSHQQDAASNNQPAINENNALGRVMAAAQRVKPEFLENGIDEAVLREIPALRRGIGTLAVLAGIPPLLGLLGTVGGMIETFDVISAVGNANSQLLSGGIAQALLTTKLGLITAIPLLLLHCALKNKSTHLVEVLEQQAAGLIVAQRHVDSRS